MRAWEENSRHFCKPLTLRRRVAKWRLFSLATTTNSTFDSFEPPYISIGLGVINLVFNV